MSYMIICRYEDEVSVQIMELESLEKNINESYWGDVQWLKSYSKYGFNIEEWPQRTGLILKLSDGIPLVPKTKATIL